MPINKICIICGRSYQVSPCNSSSKYCSQKCSQKGHSINYRDENSSQWKGDKAGYHSIHYWVKSRKKKLKVCEFCKEKEPHDLANISGEYKRDITDYHWLCRSCHMQFDSKDRCVKCGYFGHREDDCTTIFKESNRKRDSIGRFIKKE